MTTVTITGNTIRGATTSKDNRTWQIRAVAYQYGGSGGGVITPGADWETLYPVDGVLTFTAEAGSVVEIKTPDEVPYRVRIPTSNAGLWDVIEAGVAYQPDVAQDILNRAVENAAPGFIAAELGLQTADAITADLAARRITFTDLGDGEGHFSVGGVPISGTLVPPGALWSSLAGRPTFAADSVARNGETDDYAYLAADDDEALAMDGGIPLMLRKGVHRVGSNLTIDSPVWFLPGAIIKPDSGVTVTLAGGIVNAPMSQIFDTSAGGVVVPENAPFMPPQWWGAVGDGVTDDTDAIEAAWSAAIAVVNGIYFPPGNYRYNGTGLDGSVQPLIGMVLHIRGAGQHLTTITLGPSSYLLTPSNLIGSLVLEDVRIVGGKGAIKHTFTAEDTVGTKHISRVRFNDYTECAVATESMDSPFWFIDECWFTAANATDTIGIALPVGLTDGCTITKCNFQRNRVHVKAGFGNNMYITENGFIESTDDNSGGPRAAVWIVPTDGTTNNAGNGLCISRNKFGAEFIADGDYRILYADEGAGDSNGIRMPVLDADSTGVIMGHTITENFFRKGGLFSVGGVGGDDYCPPVVYSTTPKVFNLAIFDNQVMDSATTILEYRTTPAATTYLSTGNYFGAVIGSDTNNHVGPLTSNDPAAGHISDPSQVLQTRVGVIRENSSGSSPSYSQLLSTAITSFGSDSATISGITDAFGGTDAATIQLTGSYGVAATALSSFVAGVPVWVEFDIAAGASNSLTELKVYVNDNTALVHWVRIVEVPSAAQGWVRYAFSFVPRNTGTSSSLVFIGFGSSGDRVKIGRPRVYHSHERLLGGRRSAIAGAATSQLTNRQLTNDLRNKLIEAGVVSGTPYSDPGTPVRYTDLYDTNGNPILGLTPIANAVNYITAVNAAAGGTPGYQVVGEANAGMALYSAGTGSIQLRSTNGSLVLFCTPVESGANYFRITAGAAGNPPTIKADGSDSNVDLNLITKNAGVVKANGDPVGVKVAVPASSSSTGTPGQWAVDSSAVYYCTAANTWVKTAITSTSW